MTKRRLNKIRPAWEIAKSSLGSVFPPPQTAVSDLLANISDCLRKKRGIWGYNLIDPWERSSLKTAADELKSLQAVVNKHLLPRGRIPTDDEGWDSLDRGDSAWNTISNCQIPPSLSLYYVLALSVADQDLSDLTRYLHQSIASNLKNYGTASQGARSALDWLKGLAMFPLPFTGAPDPEFARAYQIVESEIKKRKNIVASLGGKPRVAFPIDHQAAKEALEESHRRGYIKQPITPELIVSSAQVFKSLNEAMANYLPSGIKPHLKRVPSRPYFLCSLNAIYQILVYTSNKEGSPHLYGNNTIKNLFELIGVDINCSEVLRKAPIKDLFQLSPDNAFYQLIYTRALLGL